MIISIASLVLLPWFQVPFKRDPQAWVVTCWCIAAAIVGMGRFFDAGFLALFILGFILAGVAIAIKYRAEF